VKPDKNEHEDPKPAAVPRGSKRPYASPRLTEYGSIAKLTQGTGSLQADTSGGGFKKTCL